MGLVVALVAWMLGDDFQARLPGLEQQIRTASNLSGRDAGLQLDAAKRAADDARRERTAIERRLQSSDSAQVSRARLGQVLRRHCAASGAQSCAVRLSDISGSGTTPGAGSAPSPATAPGVQVVPGGLREARGAANIEALGLSKGRAIISGTFQGPELTQLVTMLATDPEATWRINGVLVRGNAFELDVERHLRASPETGSAAP